MNLWYKVGSKDEKPGRTGFAHLFEHLMFQGSQHHDNEYFGPLEKLGAQINGSTTTDRTNYYEAVPSNGLELALWLESDRMGFLLPALTQEKLDNQRDVVKNERRQRVDNVPYGQRQERLAEALYPAGPPLPPLRHRLDGRPLGGEPRRRRDLLPDLLRPNNASLCIAGDFDPAEAKKLVDKYFGPIPAGPRSRGPPPSVAEPDRAEARDDDRRRPARPDPARLADRRRPATRTRRRSTSWPRSSASSPTRTGSSGPSCTTSNSPPRPRRSTRPAPWRAPSASRSPPGRARSSTT